MESSQHIHQTLDHLFRHESGKLVSVLTKIFGPHNLELSEDVVQDTLLTAMHSWKMNGIPDQPGAWLFKAARNKVLDQLRRDKRQRAYASDVSYLLNSEYTLSLTVDELMNKEPIEDDLLRMMFTCCHPQLAPESQVALILKTLCGFSIAEIAKAFITSNDTIEKRLYRAKQKFREQEIAYEIPANEEVGDRLENVLTAIYLLFNEGYNSAQPDQLIRMDLMEESLRLAQLLLRNPSTRVARVWALLALICFNMARSAARIDADGNILLLNKQDRNLWNHQMINQGIEYLEESAQGELLTPYHLEAGIAFEHVTAPSYESTNWENILRYYDLLYRQKPTPIIALNRSVVISELKGAAEGIKAIEGIRGIEELKNYYLLPAILGDLHFRLGDREKAAAYFARASDLTASFAEKKLLREKMGRT